MHVISFQVGFIDLECNMLSQEGEISGLEESRKVLLSIEGGVCSRGQERGNSAGARGRPEAVGVQMQKYSPGLAHGLDQGKAAEAQIAKSFLLGPWMLVSYPQVLFGPNSSSSLKGSLVALELELGSSPHRMGEKTSGCAFLLLALWALGSKKSLGSSLSLIASLLCWFPRATIPRYHKPDGFKNRNLLFYSSWGQKSEIQVSVGPRSF